MKINHAKLTSKLVFGTLLSFLAVAGIGLVSYEISKNTAEAFTAANRTYNFNSDTLGKAPTGVVVDSGQFQVLDNPQLGQSMAPTAHSGTGSGVAVATFSNFPYSDYQQVVWKTSFTAGGTRSGMLLRAQEPGSGSGWYLNGRSGYLFQANGSGGPALYVLKSNNGGGAGLMSAGSCGGGTPINTTAWYRATANGSTLTFEQSLNGIAWTTLCTTTDTTFTSGQVQFMNGFNTGPNLVAIDDVTYNYNSDVSGPTAPLNLNGTVSGTSVNLTWSAPASDGGSPLIDYKVEYKRSTDGAWQIFDDGIGKNLNATVTGLDAGTSYDFRVSGINIGTGAGASIGTITRVTAGVIPAVAVTTPASYQVVQRDAATNKADIKISGTYQGAPTAIEASWNGGPFQVIATAPTGGTYSGQLSGQNAGQGTLTVRFANNNAVLSATTQVGIGDIFVIAGQSNFSGRGFNNQVYTAPGSGVSAVMFGNDDKWKALVDPFDSNAGQIDNVSGDGAAGSLVPLLASSIAADQNVPVAFIPTAKGGSGIASWLPAANHKLSSTLFGSMERRIDATGGKVRAVLWFQGETDAQNCVSAATYTTNMNTIVNTINADYPGLKTLVGQIGHDTYGGACVDAIRGAQADLPNTNPNALPGAFTYDINLADEGGDTLHFKSDGDLRVFAYRWWSAVSRFVYGNDVITSPTVTGSDVTFNRHANYIDIVFPVDISDSTSAQYTNNLGGSLAMPNASAFNIYDPLGSSAMVQSITKITPNTIRIQMSGDGYDQLVVTYASAQTGVNNAIYTDGSFVPVQPFYNLTPNIVDIPTAPIVNSASVSSGKVNLSWSAPSDNGSSVNDYIIEYRATGGTWQVYSDGISGATTATVSGLTDGVEYSFRVRAVNAIGESDNSNIVKATPVSVPLAPATEVTDRVLNWDAPTDGGSIITGYTIQYRTLPNGSWQVYRQVDGGVNSTELTGLVDGIKYEFRVAAINAEGIGEYGQAVSYQTPAINNSGNDSQDSGSADSNNSKVPNTGVESINLKTAILGLTVSIVVVIIAATIARRHRRDSLL